MNGEYVKGKKEWSIGISSKWMEKVSKENSKENSLFHAICMLVKVDVSNHMETKWSIKFSYLWDTEKPLILCNIYIVGQCWGF